MFKKILKTIFVAFSLIFISLWIMNWSIYYRLDVAGLRASDTKHRYVFNEQVSNSPGLVYAALGDSLTAGVGVSDYGQSYPYLIAKKIAGTDKKVTHLNYSYSGARTSNIINDLLAQVILEKPDVVTLLIGTNDVHGNVSQAEFKRNYEIIVTQLKTQTDAKINVVSIPFIGVDSLLLPPYNYYYHARIISFNKIISEIAVANNVNYIDLATQTAKYSSALSDYYAADGFHLSAWGYEYWAQIIYDHLNR